MSVTTIAVRRNTAVLAESLVEHPTLNMLREEVANGTMMFSFDPSVPANEPLVFLADGEGTRDVDQHLEHPFNMVNWCVKKVMLPNVDTGVESPAIRVVLIDDEMETLAFASVGIAASLDLIRTLRGDGPYAPPIPVVFKRVQTRRGFSTIKMRPAVTPAVKKTK